jgi:uncharacterized protein
VDAGNAIAEGRIAKRAGIADKGRRAMRGCSMPRLDLARQAAAAPDAGPVQPARERPRRSHRVFGDNLKDLLLAAPAGARGGLDPGIRTGCKIAVVDATGKLLDTATIYPHEPRRDWDSRCTCCALCIKHGVS